MTSATGEPPRLGRALARSLLAVLAGASVLILSLVALSDPPSEGYSAGELAFLYAALAIVAASAVGHAWATVDQRKQALQDKLFSVVILRFPSAA